MPKLNPHAEVEVVFSGEPVTWAELEPLFVNVLRLSIPAGSRGDFGHDLPVLAEGAGFCVTAHQYHGEKHAKLECSCAEWGVGRPCRHVAMVTAKIAA